jgi:serine/arginine repetitive matrix protein 1
MQINLTGFLNGKNARTFMGELWKLLNEAQNNAAGIPQEFIDKKIVDMKVKKVR